MGGMSDLIIHPLWFSVKQAEYDLYFPARKYGSDWSDFPHGEEVYQISIRTKSPNYKPPWNLEDKEIGNVVHNKPTNWSYLT